MTYVKQNFSILIGVSYTTQRSISIQGVKNAHVGGKADADSS